MRENYRLGVYMERKEKKRYIFTLLFTLIAIVFMAVYSFTTFYANAVSDMVAMGRSSLEEETVKLNSYLTKGMDVLQVTAITLEYLMQRGASAEEIESFLVKESERYKAEIDENFTGIYGLFNGVYIDGIGWVPDEDYVPREREWYIAAEKGAGRPVVVSPYLDAQTNTIMISVSQMLYDNDSVISLDIVLEEIQIITEEINLDNMGYGFVIDKEGLVVAHTDKEEKGKNYNEEEQMRQLIRQVFEEKSSSFSTTINGEKCMVFVANVMNDWYVAMIISNTKLFHGIRGILIQDIFVCLIVFALITYFCTQAFHKIGLHMKNAEESRRDLEQMNLTVMRTLARAIDAKDRYTNGHSQRVAKYSLELAKRLGKDEQTQQDIYFAALLHDVGKIHVPDTIINKASRLTDEEFAYIKLHPVAGYHILKDIRSNALIAQGAKWHHERFDGNGYPDGLARENIPEVARIIGVADAYDAMSSTRSYRSVMPQAQVRSEIEKGRGTQFDPQIADIMLGLIDADTEYEMRQHSGTTKNILVVDDEEINLDVIGAIIENEPGYRVYKEKSGKGALNLLAQTPMDLILLDIQMPDMDGFAFYREMRKTSDVPVVFITVDKEYRTIQRAAEIGIEDYIVKPFMPQVILEIIHSILQERADIN